MTNRHVGYLVVLEEPIREDDAEPIINAIQHIKGVLEVKPVENDPKIQIAKLQVRSELASKIWAVLYPEAKT